MIIILIVILIKKGGILDCDCGVAVVCLRCGITGRVLGWWFQSGGPMYGWYGSDLGNLPGLWSVLPYYWLGRAVDRHAAVAADLGIDAVFIFSILALDAIDLRKLNSRLGLAFSSLPVVACHPTCTIHAHAHSEPFALRHPWMTCRSWVHSTWWTCTTWLCAWFSCSSCMGAWRLARGLMNGRRTCLVNNQLIHLYN